MLLDRLNNFNEKYKEIMKQAEIFYQKEKSGMLLSEDYNILIELLGEMITNLFLDKNRTVSSDELSNFILSEKKIKFFTSKHTKEEVFSKLLSYISLIEQQSKNLGK